MMMKIPKQEYTAEFKEQTLRNWAKLAAAGKLNSAGSQVVTPEQMDLSRLRAENVRLNGSVVANRIANTSRILKC